MGYTCEQNTHFLRTVSRILYSGQHFESSVWLQICERRRRNLISWNGSFAWADGRLINDYNPEEYVIEILLECLVQDSIMDDFFLVRLKLFLMIFRKEPFCVAKMRIL